MSINMSATVRQAVTLPQQPHSKFGKNMPSIITYSVADKMTELLKKYNVQVLESADNNLHSSVLSFALLPSVHQIKPLHYSSL